MKILLPLFIPLFLFSKVHYAKVEPYTSIILKSSVTALVKNVKLQYEGRLLSNVKIIQLDDKLDQLNLTASKRSKTLIKEMLSINIEIAKSLKESVTRFKGYYNRINRLRTISKTQKDNAYNSFSSSKTQYLTTKEKIINLKKQILDMEYKISTLKDSISKKSIVIKNKYLYELKVKEGDFVTMGSPLARVDDFSKAKLVIFLDYDEINKKTIYMNDKKTNYRVNKVWHVADDRYISSYRAEIYIKKPRKQFSKLIKIEIK